jgi:hypothetical protein
MQRRNTIGASGAGRERGRGGLRLGGTHAWRSSSRCVLLPAAEPSKGLQPIRHRLFCQTGSQELATRAFIIAKPHTRLPFLRLAPYVGGMSNSNAVQIRPVSDCLLIGSDNFPSKVFAEAGRSCLLIGQALDEVGVGACWPFRCPCEGWRHS